MIDSGLLLVSAATLFLIPVVLLLVFSGCHLIHASRRVVTIMPVDPEPWPGEHISFRATPSPAIASAVMDWTLDRTPASAGTPTFEYTAPAAITAASRLTLGVQVRDTDVRGTTTIRLTPPDGLRIEPAAVTLPTGTPPPRFRVFASRRSEGREIPAGEVTWSNARSGEFTLPIPLNPRDASNVTVRADWSGVSATAAVRLTGWPVLRINCGGDVDVPGDNGVDWLAEPLSGDPFTAANYSVDVRGSARGTRQTPDPTIPLPFLRSCRYATEITYQFRGFNTSVTYQATLFAWDFISGAAGPYYGNAFLTDAGGTEFATPMRPEDGSLFTARVQSIRPRNDGGFTMRFRPDNDVDHLAFISAIEVTTV